MTAIPEKAPPETAIPEAVPFESASPESVSPESVSACAIARRIWQAGVAAVAPQTLMANVLRSDDAVLQIGDSTYPWSQMGRLVVVGAGKAGAGMAAAVEEIVGPARCCEKVVGWVNVPAGCERPLLSIQLHPARPAGVNEPTVAGVAGTAEILKLVRSLVPGDVCLVLLSGGGSALMPAPVAGISLADKQQTTRFLSRAGASISELNAVRTLLSEVKGGGLLRAATAGTVHTLVISDVIGDPLDVIASGPTLLHANSARFAADVLNKFDPRRQSIPAAVFAEIERRWNAEQAVGDFGSVNRADDHSGTVPVFHQIIGNNATAVCAAAREAERLGLQVLGTEFDAAGFAEAEGTRLAGWTVRQRLAGQSSAGQSSAGQSSAGQSSAGQSSAGQSSAGQSSAGQSSAGQSSAGQGSAGQGSAERVGDATSLVRGRCFISGGEPLVVVRAVADSTTTDAQSTDSQTKPRSKKPRGGRNQHLVLAAVAAMQTRFSAAGMSDDDRWCVLSGGTDGEDGPTAAAGAWCDADGLRRAASRQLDAAAYLAEFDSTTFFEAAEGLLTTGPTHTNVMDVRVCVVLDHVRA